MKPTVRVVSSAAEFNQLGIGAKDHQPFFMLHDWDEEDPFKKQIYRLYGFEGDDPLPTVINYSRLIFYPYTCTCEAHWKTSNGRRMMGYNQYYDPKKKSPDFPTVQRMVMQDYFNHNILQCISSADNLYGFVRTKEEAAGFSGEGEWKEAQAVKDYVTCTQTADDKWHIEMDIINGFVELDLHCEGIIHNTTRSYKWTRSSVEGHAVLYWNKFAHVYDISTSKFGVEGKKYKYVGLGNLPLIASWNLKNKFVHTVVRNPEQYSRDELLSVALTEELLRNGSF